MSLISEAFASAPVGDASTATAAAPSTGSIYGDMLFPMLTIFVVFYFFIIRPQQKKMREHKEMLDSLKRGDKVITAGGIIGVVSRVEPENEIVVVEVAPEIKVKVSRPMISTVLTRTGVVDVAGKGKSKPKPSNDVEPDDAEKSA